MTYIFVIFEYMHHESVRNKRVVVVNWKKQAGNDLEVFSNLKNFCLSYPQYNYNTLNNYLSKGKIAYETDSIRVERKIIITQPKHYESTITSRQIAPVIRKVQIKKAGEKVHDLAYWLSQSSQKRLEAVTFIITQSLKKGERMDKTYVKTIRQPL